MFKTNHADVAIAKIAHSRVTQSIMNGFTQDTVFLFIAHLTGELIYIIVIETECFAVWCLAIESVVPSPILKAIILFLWS